jgi:hypothetical protein
MDERSTMDDGYRRDVAPAMQKRIEDAEAALTYLRSKVTQVEGERDHAARMVEAAIDYMTYDGDGFECGMCSLCPLEPSSGCKAITAKDCRRLIRDYLDKNAKEAPHA